MAAGAAGPTPVEPTAPAHRRDDPVTTQLDGDLAARARDRLSEESAVTGRLRIRLADVLRRAGAPDSEQLSCLTEAITSLSATLGPADPETSAFAQLAIVALEAEAVEVAVTAAEPEVHAPLRTLTAEPAYVGASAR